MIGDHGAGFVEGSANSRPQYDGLSGSKRRFCLRCPFELWSGGFNLFWGFMAGSGGSLVFFSRLGLLEIRSERFFTASRG